MTILFKQVSSPWSNYVCPRDNNWWCSPMICNWKMKPGRIKDTLYTYKRKTRGYTAINPNSLNWNLRPSKISNPITSFEASGFVAHGIWSHSSLHDAWMKKNLYSPQPQREEPFLLCSEHLCKSLAHLGLY